MQLQHPVRAREGWPFVERLAHSPAAPSARPKKASVHRFIGCEWVEGIAGVYETNVTA
jgi:hypothetical protein